MPQGHEEHSNFPLRHLCCLRCVMSRTMLNTSNGEVCSWDEVGAENFTNAHQIWRICNASHDTDDLLLINEQTKSWIKSEGEHRIVSLTQDANIPEARWRMEHVRDDVYRFRNVRDNRCVLDLAAGLGGCGIKLYAWPEHGGPNQQWIMKQK